MQNELNILKQKYEEITLNSIVIDNRYYHDVLEKTSYQKISKGPLLNIRAFEAQIFGHKLSKELKKLPKIIKNTHVYHFDHDDNVLMIQIYGQTDNIIHRHYYFYADDQIESIYFNSGGESVRNIALSIHKDHQIKKLINYAAFGYSISDYIYEDDRLKAINVQQKEHHQDECSTSTMIFEYSNQNLSKIIQCYPNGYENTRYP